MKKNKGQGRKCSKKQIRVLLAFIFTIVLLFSICRLAFPFVHESALNLVFRHSEGIHIDVPLGAGIIDLKHSSPDDNLEPDAQSWPNSISDSPPVPGTPHASILINNDADFANQATAEGWPGNGSPGNPYVIDGLDIDLDSASGNCIEVRNVRSFFTIRNCRLEDALGAGIRLSNTSNGCIANNTCSNNQHALSLSQSSSNIITNNTCNANWGGIILAYSNSNQLTGNAFCGSTQWDGLDIYNSEQNQLIRNICDSNAENGVSVSSSNNNTLKNNRCRNNAGSGIWLDKSTSIMLRNNTCSGNHNGITLASNNTAIYNTCTGNSYGALTMGSNNTVANNNCSSEAYTCISVEGSWQNPVGNNQIANNTCLGHGTGISLSWSSYNQLSNNTCRGGNFGVHLSEGADFNTIANCTVSDCASSQGIYLYKANSNELAYVTLTNNWDGIDVVQSNYNTIVCCTICNSNSYGVSIRLESHGNSFTWNTISDNNVNARDEGSSNTFDYNFWSDYSGTDVNGDGVGDTPRPIGPGSNFDSRPLMLPPGSPATWLDPPTDQFLGPGATLCLDLNATAPPPGLDNWWLNDTTHFSINSLGVVTNITALTTGSWGLQVSVNDSLGNILQGTFTITVDITAPAWIGDPSDQINELGTAFRYDLNATDGSGIDSWWLNDTIRFVIDGLGIITNATNLPIGIFRVQVSVNDTFGNELTSTFQVTVHDTTPPTWLETPSNQDVELGGIFRYGLNATDLSGIDHWWINDTVHFVIDDTGVITNATTLPVGVYGVQVQAYDSYANYRTGTFRVTVQDTTPPTWDPPPSDRIIELGTGFTYDMNASDLSGIDHYWVNSSAFTVNGAGVITNATSLPVGVYWLQVRAYDSYTNYCSATFKLTVQDTLPPTWAPLPTDQVVEFSRGFRYDLNATDSSGINIWWVNDTAHFAIDSAGVITNATQLAVGVYGLEVRAHDPYSHYCSATLKLTVRDTTPPTWDQLPSDQIVECGTRFGYDVNASDLSGIDHYWVNSSAFSVNGAGIVANATYLAVGVYWLEMRAYDSYTNYCSATFKLTVQDTLPPTWAPLPTNQVVEFPSRFRYDLNATDSSGIDYYWINDTAHFAIDSAGVITNVTALGVGVYGVQVRAHDPYSHYCSAVFAVTVQDNTAPTWDQLPSDQIVECGTRFGYDVNASDLSGINLYWVNDTVHFAIDSAGVITNVTSLPVGVYWLEVRSYDPYSLYCSATFKVTVQDTQPPTWDQLPANQVVEYGRSFRYDLNATDLSGIDHWWLNDTIHFNIDGTGVITAGALPVGIYRLQVRAYDPYTSYCVASFSVAVQDTQPPTWAVIPTDQVMAYGEALDYQLSAWDLSGIDHWTVNDTVHFVINANGRLTSITPLAPGRYGLVVTVYDPYNNPLTATISVTAQPSTTTTTTTTSPPGIPGFPWSGILLACITAVSLSVLRRRRIHDRAGTRP